MERDDRLATAAQRLAALDVLVPDPHDVIARHDRRPGRAALVVTTVLLLGLLAVAVAVLPRSNDQEVALDPADSGQPAAAAIGLAEAQDGIWPAADRHFGTPEELGRAFGSEVLGWAAVVERSEPAAPLDGPQWVTIAAAGREPIDALAVPRGDGFTFVQIGSGPPGLSFAAEGPDDVPFLRAQAPDGTVAIRWWARSGGAEVGPVDVPFPGEIPLPGSAAAPPSSVVALYLDPDGQVLGATGGTYEAPPSGSSLVPWSERPREQRSLDLQDMPPEVAEGRVGRTVVIEVDPDAADADRSLALLTDQGVLWAGTLESNRLGDVMSLPEEVWEIWLVDSGPDVDLTTGTMLATLTPEQWGGDAALGLSLDDRALQRGSLGTDGVRTLSSAELTAVLDSWAVPGKVGPEPVDEAGGTPESGG